MNKHFYLVFTLLLLNTPMIFRAGIKDWFDFGDLAQDKPVLGLEAAQAQQKKVHNEEALKSVKKEVHNNVADQSAGKTDEDTCAPCTLCATAAGIIAAPCALIGSTFNIMKDNPGYTALAVIGVLTFGGALYMVLQDEEELDSAKNFLILTKKLFHHSGSKLILIRQNRW